jgi:hypothetical protein
VLREKPTLVAHWLACDASAKMLLLLLMMMMMMGKPCSREM